MICHLMQIHVISCSQKIAQAMSDDLLRGPSSLKEMQECFKCERWHRLLLLLLSAMIHLSKASSKLHQISETLPLVVDRLTFLHRRSLEPALDEKRSDQTHAPEMGYALHPPQEASRWSPDRPDASPWI